MNLKKVVRNFFNHISCKCITICSLLLLGSYEPVAADSQLTQHLPNLTIHGFAQDQVGYMWIATDNGLCRYNGQTYYHYQSEPDNPGSLPANRVYDIRTDNNGTLWIVSANGICVYNSLHDNFESLLAQRGLHHITCNGQKVLCSGSAGWCSSMPPAGKYCPEKKQSSTSHKCWKPIGKVIFGVAVQTEGAY